MRIPDAEVQRVAEFLIAEHGDDVVREIQERIDIAKARRLSYTAEAWEIVREHVAHEIELSSRRQARVNLHPRRGRHL